MRGWRMRGMEVRRRDLPMTTMKFSKWVLAYQEERVSDIEMQFSLNGKGTE